MREPTLPLHEAFERGKTSNFTSPLGARLHLWWLGLTGRARQVSAMDSNCRIKGWLTHEGIYYITRVRQT